MMLYPSCRRNTVVPPAAAPANFARSASGTDIVFTWDAVANAATYRLQNSLNGTSGWASLASGIVGLTYTLVDGTIDPPAYYRVRAENAGGNGPWSSSIQYP